MTCFRKMDSAKKESPKCVCGREVRGRVQRMKELLEEAKREQRHRHRHRHRHAKRHYSSSESASEGDYSS